MTVGDFVYEGVTVRVLTEVLVTVTGRVRETERVGDAVPDAELVNVNADDILLLDDIVLVLVEENVCVSAPLSVAVEVAEGICDIVIVADKVCVDGMLLVGVIVLVEDLDGVCDVETSAVEVLVLELKGVVDSVSVRDVCGVHVDVCVAIMLELIVWKGVPDAVNDKSDVSVPVAVVDGGKDEVVVCVGHDVGESVTLPVSVDVE